MKNIIECLAILLIIGAMVLIYLRAGKKKMAISAIPIAFVPLMHFFAWVANISMNNGIIINSYAYIVFDLIGLTATAVMAGICSSKFSKKFAAGYLSVVILFSVALCAILIINNLQIALDK